MLDLPYEDKWEELPCSGDYYAVGSGYALMHPGGTTTIGDYTINGTWTFNYVCEPYSGNDAKRDIEFGLLTDQIVEYENHEGIIANRSMSGASLKYDGTVVSGCESTSFTVNSYCDWNLTIDETRYNPIAGNDKCAPVVTIVSQLGCNVFDRSIIWEYLDKAAPYLGFFAIGFGFLLCFFGLKAVRPSIFIIGLLGGTILGVVIFYAFYSDAIEINNQFWYFLGGGVAAGLILGILLACFVRVGAAIAGAFGGACLGAFVYEAALSTLGMQWVFWTLVVCFGAIAAAGTFKYFDHIFIIATALFGSYLLTRGIGCYAGHYYTMGEISTMVAEGIQIDKYYWCYIAGFFVFTVIGMALQFCMRRRAKAKKDEFKAIYVSSPQEGDVYDGELIIKTNTLL